MNAFRYPIAGLIAALALAVPATAQSVVFQIDDNTGTPFVLMYNDGTITLPQGAINGYVLTSDATGNATWMPAPSGGLSLPFAGRTTTTAAAFAVENTSTNVDASALQATSGGDGLVVASAGTPSLTFGSPGKNGVEVRGAEGLGLFVAQGDGGGVQVFQAGAPSQSAQSSSINGFMVNGAEGVGLFVGHADRGGVFVASAGEDGIRVVKAGTPTATNASSSNNGVEVQGAEGHGLFVGHADDDGVHVASSSEDGVHVVAAGNPSQTIADPSGVPNGVEIEGSLGNGVFVGRTDQSGFVVQSTLGDGVDVRSAGTPSQTINSGLSNGFEVDGAQGNGLYVGQADESGVHVASAGEDGIRVVTAGSPTATNAGSRNNGVEVQGAEGDGLFVGYADQSGVAVSSAANHGLQVSSAGFDGVHVASAGRGGVFVGSAQTQGLFVAQANTAGVLVGSAGDNGVHVNSAGDNGVQVTSADKDGVLVIAAGEHAGNFNNNGGSGKPTATVFAENTSTAQGIAGWFESNGTDATLVADQDGSGDIVRAFAGGNLRFRVHNNGNVTADGTFTGGGADLAEAFAVEDDLAAYAPGDVLVISTRSNRTVAPSRQPYSTRVVGVYAAKPGVLLSERGIDETLDDRIPLGVVGVIPTNVSAENGPIRRGDLLVTAATPGHAMKADPRRLGFGMVLGKALEDYDGPGTGRIEVLVNVK